MTESVSSSPCSLADTNPAYNGFLTHDQLRELLLRLLHAETTSVRICELSQALAKTDAQREMLQATRQSRTASCEHLAHALRSIGVRPDQTDVEPCEIASLQAGLDMLARKQHWVISQITEALPGISEAPVLHQLAAILQGKEATLK